MRRWRRDVCAEFYPRTARDAWVPPTKTGASLAVRVVRWRGGQIKGLRDVLQIAGLRVLYKKLRETVAALPVARVVGQPWPLVVVVVPHDRQELFLLHSWGKILEEAAGQIAIVVVEIVAHENEEIRFVSFFGAVTTSTISGSEHDAANDLRPPLIRIKQLPTTRLRAGVVPIAGIPHNEPTHTLRLFRDANVGRREDGV